MTLRRDPELNAKTFERFLSEEEGVWREEWAPEWATRDNDPEKMLATHWDHTLSIMVWKAVVREETLTQEQLAQVGAHMVRRLMGIHSKWCRCPAAKAIRSQRSIAMRAKRRGDTETRSLEEQYGTMRRILMSREKTGEGVQ